MRQEVFSACYHSLVERQHFTTASCDAMKYDIELTLGAVRLLGTSKSNNISFLPVTHYICKHIEAVEDILTSSTTSICFMKPLVSMSIG